MASSHQHAYHSATGAGQNMAGPPSPDTIKIQAPVGSLSAAPRFPDDGASRASLLHHAQQARAYAAAQPVPGQPPQAAGGMAAALRQACVNNELRLYYQPLADLRGGAVAALEALVRWQHPQRGLLPAAEFVPLASAAGLDGALADWVLQRACQDLCAWRDAGQPGVRITLNLSNGQFRDAALPARIADTLKHYGLTPDMLTLEITETALSMAGAECDSALAAFQRHGLSLTLDDFGTGNSSLTNLNRFPFDALKIDSAFVRGVATNTSDAVMCQTMIDMAHHLGMRAVAEGVETESQCDFLQRNLCDMIQGYLFAKPLPPDAVAELLRGQHRLPPHLLQAQRRQRRLLLVDDEPNILAALKRLLRGEQYQIYTATSGQDGLDLLAQHAVDVIVSDQRMPGMLGADFLRRARELYPDTIRIMLSGYTELQSVTAAVNDGAIYKFLTKPWDDELLRKHIADAFRIKEIADDNGRLHLELHAANQELAAANQRMERLLATIQQAPAPETANPDLTPALLQQLPVAIIAVGERGDITFANRAAESLFGHAPVLQGVNAAQSLPALFPAPVNAGGDGAAPWRTIADIGGRRYALLSLLPGGACAPPGRLLALLHIEDTA